IAALIAVGAFGLNLLSPRLATLVRTDMPLALVIFLIGLLIWQKIREENEWKRRDRLYVFVLLTAAMLIKGPIVYAFLFPGHCAHCCSRRPLGDARTSHSEAPTSLARLVAMAGLTRYFSSLGNRWHSISARILRGSCDARVPRPIW